MPYTIIVADNFHYQDPDEEYTAGTFETAEQALSEARKIVDRSLAKSFKAGMTAAELFELYTMFGEAPFIVALDKAPDLSFSAWDYARSRASEIIASGLGTDAGGH